MTSAPAAPRYHPCTLIHLTEGLTGENNPNGDRFSYIRQAITLSRSLRHHGYPALTIYTNAPPLVSGFLRDVPADVRPHVVELKSASAIPRSVKFYGAHFKLDLVEQVARDVDADCLVVMLDCDVIARGPLPLPVADRVRTVGLGAYDITEQVMHATGLTDLTRDLEAVAGQSLPNARWYGGELLLGRPDALGRVATVARECCGRYLERVDSVSHQGDEMFMSAALNLLSGPGAGVVEVGAFQVVLRHWSGIPFRSFTWIRDCTFLHLPGDKALLEKWSDRPYDQRRVYRELRRRHRRKSVKWQLLLAAHDLRQRRAAR